MKRVLFVLVLIMATMSAGLGGNDYSFLSAEQWSTVKEEFDWAVPRWSPDQTTVCVKPKIGEIPGSMMARLQEVGVDTTVNVVSLEEARSRVSDWNDGGEL